MQNHRLRRGPALADDHGRAEDRRLEVEEIASAVGMRSVGSITFAQLHRWTPELTGPERLELFFSLPEEARQRCWDDLRDRLDRSHNGELE
jgi:hypothetical protein